MGHLTQLNLAPKPPQLTGTSKSLFLIPFHQTTLVLNDRVDVVRERFERLIGEGGPTRLELGQSYRVCRRRSGFVAYVHEPFSHGYSPAADVRLSPQGDRTAVKITYFAPGFLFALAWVVCLAVMTGKSHDLGFPALMTLVFSAIHVHMYAYYRQDQADTAADLISLLLYGDPAAA